jgi:hypothetical protein
LSHSSSRDMRAKASRLGGGLCGWTSHYV